jgi:hypothetical protein
MHITKHKSVVERLSSATIFDLSLLVVAVSLLVVAVFGGHDDLGSAGLINETRPI